VPSDLAAEEEAVPLCNQVATKAALMIGRVDEDDARLFLSPN